MTYKSLRNSVIHVKIHWKKSFISDLNELGIIYFCRVKSLLQVFFAVILLSLTLNTSGVKTGENEHTSNTAAYTGSAATLSAVTIAFFDFTPTPPFSINFSQTIPQPSLKEYLQDWLPDGQICRQIVENSWITRYLIDSSTLIPGLSPVFIAFPFHYFY